MSQARLAARTGVTRWTIARIEAGRHVPGSHLVHAIEHVLVIWEDRLVPGWTLSPDEDAPSRGARARQARRALGRSLDEVARACGVSAATISRFERGCAETALILAPEKGGVIVNEAYARAHMFLDAAEMELFASDLSSAEWLALIVTRSKA